jgi:hypothetical protein
MEVERASSLAALVLAGCLDPYRPPPAATLIGISPAIAVGFDRPMDLTTVEVSLSTLPEGAVVAGPCRFAGVDAERDLETGTARYHCPGATLTASATEDRIELLPDFALSPFGSYRVELSAGLRGQDGRAWRIATTLDFSVPGSLPLAPTRFASGVFFAAIQTTQPVPALLTFVMYLEVDSATGRLKVFGADFRPKDGVDRATDRDPRDYTPYPDPPSGSWFASTGQVSDQPSALLVFPFALSAPNPPVIAECAQLSGRTSTRAIDGAPSGAREVVDAALSAASVVLGSAQISLGPANGHATLFRLREDEAPSPSSLLPAGHTLGGP